MISRTIAHLPYAPCQCGRPSQLVAYRQYGAEKYKVEAFCCKMTTVLLRTERAAINEFQRIRAVLDEDANADHTAVPQPTYAPQAQRANA